MIEVGKTYRRAVSQGARIFTKIEVTAADSTEVSYKILASWNENIIGMTWRGLRKEFEAAEWIAA